MVAMLLELLAYAVILPLRLFGKVGGSRVRGVTTRVEEWILRETYKTASTGVASSFDQDGDPFYSFGLDPTVERAMNSAEAMEAESQAREANRRDALDPAHASRQRGPVQSANPDAPRSEQIREAMLRAQQERHARETQARRRRR